MNEIRLCECGCGGPTPIARQTYSNLGYAKGQQVRFIAGHQNRWAAQQDRAPRFWSKVEKTEGCWWWQGPRRSDNKYGDFYPTIFGRTVHTLAHRYAYEQVRGPIPEGLTLDHLCRNTLCVNPEHLEPVTDLENRLRGSRPPGGSHCIHGHEKTPENTYVYKGRRECRACRAGASRRSIERRRAS